MTKAKHNPLPYDPDLLSKDEVDLFGMLNALILTKSTEFRKLREKRYSKRTLGRPVKVEETAKTVVLEKGASFFHGMTAKIIFMLREDVDNNRISAEYAQAVRNALAASPSLVQRFDLHNMRMDDYRAFMETISDPQAKAYIQKAFEDHGEEIFNYSQKLYSYIKMGLFARWGKHEAFPALLQDFPVPAQTTEFMIFLGRALLGLQVYAEDNGVAESKTFSSSTIGSAVGDFLHLNVDKLIDGNQGTDRKNQLSAELNQESASAVVHQNEQLNRIQEDIRREKKKEAQQRKPYDLSGKAQIAVVCAGDQVARDSSKKTACAFWLDTVRHVQAAFDTRDEEQQKLAALLLSDSNLAVLADALGIATTLQLPPPPVSYRHCADGSKALRELHKTSKNPAQLEAYLQSAPLLSAALLLPGKQCSAYAKHALLLSDIDGYTKSYQGQKQIDAMAILFEQQKEDKQRIADALQEVFTGVKPAQRGVHIVPKM